jgi:hypothetical protein
VPLSAEQFGKALIAAGFVSVDDLKALLRNLPGDARPRDAASLSRLLIDQEKLNAFQAEELLAGRDTPLVLGDYSLIDRLGAGGMEARHRHMKRVVAVKLLPPATTKDEQQSPAFNAKSKQPRSSRIRTSCKPTTPGCSAASGTWSWSTSRGAHPAVRVGATRCRLSSHSGQLAPVDCRVAERRSTVRAAATIRPAEQRRGGLRGVPDGRRPDAHLQYFPRRSRLRPPRPLAIAPRAEASSPASR